MNKRKIARIAYLLLIVLAFSYLLFNNNGVLKYKEAKSEIDSLKGKISNTEKQRERITSEIDSLKNNKYKIEKVAREKYYMLGENEKAIKIEREAE